MLLHLFLATNKKASVKDHHFLPSVNLIATIAGVMPCTWSMARGLQWNVRLDKLVWVKLQPFCQSGAHVTTINTEWLSPAFDHILALAKLRGWLGVSTWLAKPTQIKLMHVINSGAFHWFIAKKRQISWSFKCLFQLILRQFFPYMSNSFFFPYEVSHQSSSNLFLFRPLCQIREHSEAQKVFPPLV